MQTHSIHVTNGRARVLEVRTQLFAFGEVLDVVSPDDRTSWSSSARGVHAPGRG
jgi:hypothetical protein